VLGLNNKSPGNGSYSKIRTEIDYCLKGKKKKEYGRRENVGTS
jgi:hypothetical protein